jgi:hypothetical protein
MPAARAGTEVEAANLALGHLGQPTIADLSDKSLRARAVRLHFGTVRDDLLRQKWWSFAKGWVRPAADMTVNLGPLKTRFPLPPDCLRVRYIDNGLGSIFDEESGAWDLEDGIDAASGAAIEATMLVTNIKTPLVAYTKQVTAPRLWWPDFVTVFSLQLAARCATKLGRSTQRARELREEADEKLLSASGIDSKERSTARQSRNTSWLEARGGFRPRPR